jgi:beta-galactosidase
VLASLCDEAGLVSPLPPPVRGQMELVVRSGEAGRFLFLVNRGDDEVTIEGLATIAGGPFDLVAGPSLSGVLDGAAVLRLGPRGVAVLRVAVPSST